MKLARMLGAIGVMAALAGCQTCWLDRGDYRPFKYGSLRDSLEYGWAWSGYHPKYHCGSPDGIRDHKAVKKAAIKTANETLRDQNCGDVSRDFKFGFQQAFLDIANGGSGALPAVPPPRYWSAPYRTTWGHNKAHDWFEGYQAGASAAKYAALRDAQSVPTSVSRDGDNRLAMGTAGGTFGAASVVNANYGGSDGWSSNVMSPPMGNPFPMNPYAAGPYSTNPYAGAMNAPAMNGQTPFGVSAGMGVSSPMTGPSSQGFPGSGWSTAPSPMLPAPNPAVPSMIPPNSPGGGYSIPTPGNGGVNPPVTPMSGLNVTPPAAPQRGYSAGSPWGRFSGLSGFGFHPEGASR